MFKVNTEVIKIKGDNVTLKLINPSKFKKEFDGIKKEPKGYDIIYTDLPERIILGSKITQFVKLIF